LNASDKAHREVRVTVGDIVWDAYPGPEALDLDRLQVQAAFGGASDETSLP
jgi:hypothetical protein